MYTLIHQSHGRMRVRLHALKGQASASVELLESLRSLNGVLRLSNNEITGSVVVYYEPQILCNSEILKVFRRAGHLPNIIGFPQSRKPTRPRVKKVAAKDHGLLLLASAAVSLTLLETFLRRLVPEPKASV